MGSWYNDLGLNANYNMKRESISASESDLNEDALLPFIDDMLQQRKLLAENVNAKFGTNIKVDLASSWKKIRKEIELREEEQESNISDEQSDQTKQSEVDDVSKEQEDEEVQNEDK